MTEHTSQKFRGEWHCYQGGSTVVEARSRAEAVEKEKRDPFSGDDFDLHEELDNVFVVPTDSPVAFLYPMPRDDRTAATEAGDGRISKYVVSATYRKIYAGDILAATEEDAQQQARGNRELRSTWTLVMEFEHIVASPVPDEH